MMRTQKRNQLLAVCAVCLLGAFLGWERLSPAPKTHISMLVHKEGPPDFLALKVEMAHADLNILRIQTTLTNPAILTNWGAVSNGLAVWINSQDGKFDGRLFYSQLRTNTEFDGSAWYSSRSVFGETAIEYELDERGFVVRKRKHHFDALSIKKVGWTPPLPKKPN